MKRASNRNRGFTVVELMLGLVVTSLVMGAMAAFSLAMVSAWKGSEQQQALTLVGSQTVKRLDYEIRHARLIGAARTGALESPATGAAVMLWTDDTNGDGQIQGAEVAMIIHDVATGELRLYPNGQGDNVSPWTWATFTSPTVFDSFMIGRTHRPIARHVAGAVFSAIGTTGTARNPSLEYALKLQRTDTDGKVRAMVQYGTATVRAPLAQPS